MDVSFENSTHNDIDSIKLLQHNNIDITKCFLGLETRVIILKGW